MTGARVVAVCGPSGLLRERIVQGEAADVFASAFVACALAPSGRAILASRGFALP